MGIIKSLGKRSWNFDKISLLAKSISLRILVRENLPKFLPTR